MADDSVVLLEYEKNLDERLLMIETSPLICRGTFDGLQAFFFSSDGCMQGCKRLLECFALFYDSASLPAYRHIGFLSFSYLGSNNNSDHADTIALGRCLQQLGHLVHALHCEN